MANSLDLIFSALSDTTRRKILVTLLEDDFAVTDLAEPFGISLAAISKHLKILSKAGLIEQEKRGRVTWCKLQMHAMQDALVWMDSFGQLCGLDLEKFELYLEKLDTSISKPSAVPHMKYTKDV